MNYTKGEWKAEHIGNEGKYVIHTGDLSLPFAYTFPNRYRNPQVPSEEAEANANLIAPAPDLYEALKELMEALEQFGSPSNEIRVAYNLAKPALAKAEGK